MTENVGKTDRIIRFFLGLCLVVAPLLNVPPIWSEGTWAYGAMIVGAVLIVTALAKICPAYRLIGINTCRI